MKCLEFPEKLYGRESEVNAILDCFQDAPNGLPQLVTVLGASGVGKTAIVQKVQQVIVRNGSRFIVGKCDPLQRNIPYSAAIAALHQLIHPLLSEPQSNLQQWREQILTALGTNGQVMIDVIPELEQIIGPQPPVPDLGLVESKNRFNLVFQSFLRIFCNPTQPLVIFLDDLQWADPDTLRLIQLMMSDNTLHLELIGAYRDNEVSPEHPLRTVLETIQTTGAKIQQINLPPLPTRQVNQWIADVLQDSPERTQPLSQLVFQQTAGNPLLLQKLLQNLYQEKRLTHDPGRGLWDWQLANLPQQDLTKLIDCSLSHLKPQTQHLLKRAACIGNQAPISILMAISDITEETLTEQLQDAVNAKLIVLNFGKVQFTHDRVQQTIYEQIQPNTRAAMHLTTGRLLQTANGNLFSIANHLNLGSSFLTSHEQNAELIALNLQAAQQAKNYTAFDSALQYIRTALELANRWHLTSIELYLNASEIEYANSNFSRSRELAQTILQKTENITDRAKAYELMIQAYTALNNMVVAIEVSLSAMQEFGIEICQNPPANLDIQILATLPKATDPKCLSALQILRTTCTPAYVADPSLFLKVIFTMLSLCMRYGNSPLGSYAYSLYGLVCCGVMDNIDLGIDVGQLALQLVDEFEAKDVEAKVIDIFNGHILHWKNHLSNCQKALCLGVEVGLRTGDVEYAGFSAINYSANTLILGTNLEKVEKIHKEKISFLTKLGLEYHSLYTQIGQTVASYLLGHNTSDDELDREILPKLLSSNHGPGLAYAYVAKTIIEYLLKASPKAALETAKLAERYAPAAAGLPIVTWLNFYQSLALLARHTTAAGEQCEILEKVEANQSQMKFWADHAPMNFLHKYHLVEAEHARVQGLFDRAMPLYEKAIEGANKNGYLQEEALANELAGKFHIERDRLELGQFYLMKARDCYIEWGAQAKVEALENQYAFLKPNTGNRSDSIEAEILEEFLKRCSDNEVLNRCSLNRVFRDDRITLNIDCPNEAIAQQTIQLRTTLNQAAKSLGLANRIAIRWQFEDYIRPWNVT